MKEIRVTFDGNRIDNGALVRGEGCVCKEYKTYILVKRDRDSAPDDLVEVEVDPETLNMRLLEYSGDFNGTPVYKRIYGF